MPGRKDKRRRQKHTYIAGQKGSDATAQEHQTMLTEGTKGTDRSAPNNARQKGQRAPDNLQHKGSHKLNRYHAFWKSRYQENSASIKKGAKKWGGRGNFRQKSKAMRKNAEKIKLRSRTFAIQKTLGEKIKNLKKTLKNHTFTNFTLQNATFSTDFLAPKKEKKLHIGTMCQKKQIKKEHHRERVFLALTLVTLFF